MAFPTSVNDQITDAVTQSNVKVVAEAPALAMGTIYQAMASSVALAEQNAVTMQQQANMLLQAVTAAGINNIYATDIQPQQANTTTTNK